MAGSVLKTISELISAYPELFVLRGGDPSAAPVSLEYDSRKVVPGAAFVAVEGFQSDGHKFAETAAAAGAKVLVVSSAQLESFMHLADSGVTVVESKDSRRGLSALAAAFYGFPSSRMKVIGVTGTNGKTSITYMLESIYSRLGASVGVIGTVNYRWAGREMPAANTTPESADLQKILSMMAADGVDTVVMEVSSHALDLGRADDVEFDCALFTNLTPDHLDFHSDMESYFTAKKRLFTLLEKSPKPVRSAVINTDDPKGRELFSSLNGASYQIFSYGLGAEGDFHPSENSISNRINGISYTLTAPDGSEEAVNLALAGRFHVYNSLCAAACAVSLGVTAADAAAGLGVLKSVPGRFDVIDSGSGFFGVVDYAHTPDALLKLLLSVKESADGRIITVFGCGGDRDRTKRPVMGRIAAENSDVAIVTSDNPRTEEPAAIINEILTGMKGFSPVVIADREQAIKYGVASAREHDIVVVAGKGHEDYQIIGKTKIHFDDRELLRRYFADRRQA
jgi:UDP-N-acetylmuramoyl-L-alanyl-D-glutamate--2,6-diaminopimelate ligase